MEILKEITTWKGCAIQPNHTYLINNRGHIIAYAPWHNDVITVFKTTIPLNKRYRKFIKDDHSELSKLITESENTEHKNVINKPKENVRIFKVKSKDNEYIVEQNILSNYYNCSCIGFGYRRKCRHVDAVAKKIQSTQNA